MLFALGLGDSVVAVTHECDYPAEAPAKPHLTRSVIPEGLAPAEIDAAVRERTGRGEALYELDEATLHELEPDLIVTQAVCEVCAVSFDDVGAVAERLPSGRGAVARPVDRRRGAGRRPPPRGGAARGDAGSRWRSRPPPASTASRAVEGGAAAAGGRARVARPGVHRRPLGPQMIELAGGEDVLGLPGEKSRTRAGTSWRRRAPDGSWRCPAATPGGRAPRRDYADALAALGTRVVAVDAAAYFSRPGPRLVDGVELLARSFTPIGSPSRLTSGGGAGCKGVARKRAERQIVIDASPKQCFEALVDTRRSPSGSGP